MWLNGDDLGVTRVGAPYKEAVAAISAVLGPPVHNPNPVSGCVEAQFEVSWAHFDLAVSSGKVNGWASKDPRLKTPFGVRIGTTVATLKRVCTGRGFVCRPRRSTAAGSSGWKASPSLVT